MEVLPYLLRECVSCFLEFVIVAALKLQMASYIVRCTLYLHRVLLHLFDVLLRAIEAAYNRNALEYPIDDNVKNSNSTALQRLTEQ